KQRRSRSALLLRVIVLEQLSLLGTFAECLGLLLRAARQQSHLALQRQQLLVRVGFHFETLELLDQGVAREIFVHFGGRDEFALLVLDLLRHALERLERALVGDRAHRLLNALVRLGAFLARDQDVLLPLGLFDFVVELAQRTLELLGFLAVLDPRLLYLPSALHVPVVAEQRLLGEIVSAFLDR